MPEGDTIHTLAAALRPLVVGRAVDAFRSRRLGAVRLQGARITAVEARGKHLLMHLSTGQALRTHLGMYGSWHRYRPGEAWRKPARQASVELRVGEDVLVCFRASQVELLDAGSIRETNLTHRLGPDLLAPSTASRLPEIAARAREFLDADAIVVDLLLDQRIASGLGNVYKSEIPFLRGLPPALPVRALAGTEVIALFELGARLLAHNVGGGPRRTRFERDGRGRLWVYGRAGEPCLRCERPILSARLGRHHRITFWCPGCQAPAPEARTTSTR